MKVEITEFGKGFIAGINRAEDVTGDITNDEQLEQMYRFLQTLEFKGPVMAYTDEDLLGILNRRYWGMHDIHPEDEEATDGYEITHEAIDELEALNGHRCFTMEK